MSRRGRIWAGMIPALLSLAAAAATIQVKDQRYTDAATVAAQYRLRATPTAQRLVLSDGKRTLSFQPDKHEFSVNNIKYHLAFPVVRRQNTYYLSDLDRRNLLEPLLNPSSVPRYRILNIVIDPGHGGHDNGAAGKTSCEKDLTLQVARRIAAKLAAYGYRVSLTRERDVYLSLPQRAEIARQRQADLFLSIHINAAANTGVSGIECFAITPVGAPSSGSKTAETRKYPGNSFGINSFALANQLHRHLLAGTKAADRGVKWARFQVLREINCPGSLIELGFISNRQEEARLNLASYQEAVAQAVCNAVVSYGKITNKNAPPKPPRLRAEPAR